jgi:transcriptional regulator with XRE-family HTH domain
MQRPIVIVNKNNGCFDCENNMTLGERIKSIRLLAKQSQEVFGQNLGVHKSTISKIETNRAQPSKQLLKSICRTHSIMEEWLKSGQGARENGVTLAGTLEGQISLAGKLGIQSSTDMIKNVLICLHHISSLNEELKIIERNYPYLLPSKQKYFPHDDVVIEFCKRLNNLQQSISSILLIFK